MLAVFVFCAAMAFAQGTAIAGEWSSQDDTGDGGISTIAMSQVTVDGQAANRFVGQVKMGGYQWAYLNAIFTPNADGKRAMGSARAISFNVRGNGEKYWFSIATTDVKDWAYHRYSFETKVNETVRVRVPINLMRQPDWGLSRRLQLANTEEFRWTSFVSGAESAYDLTIWDLRYE